MKLFLISQSENTGYDTFDSAVVAAKTEEAARNMHPEGAWGKSYSSWCSTPDKVTVDYLGKADKAILAGFVIKSFNAG